MVREWADYVDTLLLLIHHPHKVINYLSIYRLQKNSLVFDDIYGLNIGSVIVYSLYKSVGLIYSTRVFDVPAYTYMIMHDLLTLSIDMWAE